MRLRTLLAMVILLAVSPISVFAQDDGPSADVITQHSVEIVFPAVIRFELTLDAAPDDIARVMFTLAQDGTQLASEIADIDPETEDTPLVVTLDWPLPAGDPPELFAEMTYTWNVLLEDDTSQEFEATFSFQPGAGDWRIAGEAPLMFAIADSTLNLTGAREAVLPVYELMAAQTGAEPDFQWVIVPRDYAFCPLTEGDEDPTISPASDADTTFSCDEQDAEQILAENGFQVLKRGQPGLLSFQADVVDAMFESFYPDFWRDTDVPAWFNTGLRLLYQGNPQPLALRQVQEAARAANLYDAVELGRGQSEADIFNVWDAQATILVLYLADQYGADAPFELADAARTQGFDGALQDMIGVNWTVFLVEWERWLFTEDAEYAADWTVYLLETPTPSPSATPIPPLPSNTVPPEPLTGTSTPQQTATPLGRNMITAQPTFTATPAVLPTATNTPRPPGSLDAVIGSQLDAGEAGTTGPCPAALPALLMPGLAVVGTQYRKKQA